MAADRLQFGNVGGTWGLVPTIAGIGTIITAFFMGPLIQFFNTHVAEPMLKK